LTIYIIVNICYCKLPRSSSS